MTFTFFISTAVVCAFITVIGSIITTKMAQASAEKIARETTSKEIEKMERTWEREDLVSSDDEFADMASTVARFVYYNAPDHQRDAMEKIAAVRSKESGSIAEILDLLYDAVRLDRPKRADELLSDAINEKRSIKSGKAAIEE